MSEFKYKVGEFYECQNGMIAKVLRRTELEGYECLVCDDGLHRYDRSGHNEDAGRVTGSSHDYSDPFNFKRN